MQPIQLSVPKEQMPAKFIETASFIVKETLNRQGWVLRCEDLELETDEVSGEKGLLPLILWLAGQSIEKIWPNQDLLFRVDQKAMCGVVPDFKHPLVPQSIWLHAIHYELEQVAEHNPNGPGVINEWFNRWNAALQQKKIKLLPPKSSSPLN